MELQRLLSDISTLHGRCLFSHLMDTSNLFISMRVMHRIPRAALMALFSQASGEQGPFLPGT